MKIIIKNATEAESLAAAFKVDEKNVKIIEGYAEITIADFSVKADCRFYKLGVNENVFTVSSKLNIPSTVLEEANKNIIFAEGVTIFVPEFIGKTYTVMPLDSIKSIADKLNVAEEELKRLNKLNYIFAGQILLVG